MPAHNPAHELCVAYSALSLLVVTFVAMPSWPCGEPSVQADATPAAQLGLTRTELQGLRTWIQRYPAGTRFSIRAFTGGAQPTPGQAERQYPEIVRLLHDSGMELVNPNPWDEFGRCKRGQLGTTDKSP